MSIQKKNIKNICSLYASEWHLAFMLLPYISEGLKNGVKFETILKKDIEENITQLISKRNVDETEKQKMKNINWKLSNIENEEDIEKFMNKITIAQKNIDIILTGTSKQVKDNLKYINNWIDKNIEKIDKEDIKIGLICCFRALEDEDDIKLIINNFDYALNTLGEHKIENEYNSYKKVISC